MNPSSPSISPIEDFLTPISFDDNDHYDSLSKDELIKLLRDRDDQMEELKTIVSEQSSQLNAFHGREMKKERETASSPLSSKPVTPCCIHNTSPIPAENNNMMALVALGIENNQTINDLSAAVSERDKKIARRNAAIKALKQFITNQQESIDDLTTLIDSVVMKLNEEELTDEQKLLVSCYKISHQCDDSNSDIENVLDVEDPVPPSALVSPRPPSMAEEPCLSHSLHLFLRSSSVILQHSLFDMDDIVNKDVGKEMQQAIATLLTRMDEVLTEGVHASEWTPDTESCCQQCFTPFTPFHRRQ
ncbi:hypothetical protein WA588_000342 [Blastocystis sp. NMH]